MSVQSILMKIDSRRCAAAVSRATQICKGKGGGHAVGVGYDSAALVVVFKPCQELHNRALLAIVGDRRR